MSWWVRLESEPNHTVEVPVHTEGGTYSINGSNEAELSVTYNYGRHFHFRDELDHRCAKDTIPRLLEKIAELGIKRDLDYWTPTEGNVGYALSILLVWAAVYPNAVWRVS